MRSKFSMNSLTIRKTILGIFLFALAFGLKSEVVVAQVVNRDWSPLFRLSSRNGIATEASLTADQYGYAHAFWSEDRGDNRAVIQYSRFDGQNWTVPNDVILGGGPFESATIALEGNERLHLAWTRGFAGQVSYSSAPLLDAISARSWQNPIELGVRAQELQLLYTADDVLHVIYAAQGGEPGVFYMRSTDQGQNWSHPIWLDKDIPAEFVPISLHANADEVGAIHVSWAYKSINSSDGDWVRYAHSIDGGLSWSSPFTIAKDKPDHDTLNAFVRPIMTVSGQNVHIIWAGGDLLYRHHRFSTDGGQSWSEPVRVFGNLNGQAGDGFAVDEAGRVHYFGQIRFPQGIYHAVWDNNEWSEPNLVYLLRRNAGDSFEDNVEAHRTFPIVRAGNQLVLTFTDGPTHPNRRLFSIHRKLEGVSSASIMPTPMPTDVAQSAIVEDTEIITASPNLNIPDLPANQASPIEPAQSLYRALTPPILLLAGVIAFHVWNRRRR